MTVALALATPTETIVLPKELRRFDEVRALVSARVQALPRRVVILPLTR